MSDLIDRQEALKALSFAELGMECEAIEALPSAHKTGEWIEQEDCFMDTYYKCSECGFEWKFISGTPKENGANYCPRCGADVRGGDAE